MTSQQDPAPLGPLELLDAARTKYNLALARVRRGLPELALLSVHGSLEDALRAHGLRLRLDAAHEPFPQLLEALTQVEQLPLSGAEAEGIRRMHRLRARIAHGEQVVVAAETLEGYHRLAARLLPRYGVVVVAPEPSSEGAPERQAAGAATPRTRPGETTAALARDRPDTRRRGETAALDRGLAPATPPRERTVYPDHGPVRYSGRVLPSAATRDLPLAREMLGGQRRSGPAAWLEDLGERWQRWLLPVVIVISIFLIGLVISASLGQMRAEPMAPTAAVAVTPVAPLPTAAPGAALPAPPAVATAAPDLATTAGPTVTAGPGEFAVGLTAYVRADAGALNVRQSPGLAAANPIQVVLSPGTAVQIVGGPTVADDLVWWQVRAASVEGWCVGQYLEVR